MQGQVKLMPGNYWREELMETTKAFVPPPLRILPSVRMNPVTSFAQARGSTADHPEASNDQF